MNMTEYVEKMPDGVLACDVSLWVEQIERGEGSDAIEVSYARITPRCFWKTYEDVSTGREENGAVNDAKTEAE